jgi:uncharacterized protein
MERLAGGPAKMAAMNKSLARTNKSRVEGNIEKAASEIPDDGFSVLLSHTPEIYRQAAHGGFDLLVSGHTHGDQICLPGSIPITLDSVLPRHMGSGPWKHRDMVGYTSVGVGTSVVPVRINCLPEITLHHLQCSA